jgi:hypothetical protein
MAAHVAADTAFPFVPQQIGGNDHHWAGDKCEMMERILRNGKKETSSM